MKCIYTAVYKLQNFNSLPDGQDVELVDLPDDNAKAYLTVNPDDACFHIDRFSALCSLVLKAIFHNEGGGDFQSKLEVRQNEIEEQRKKEHGSGVFLVIEGQVNVENTNFKKRQDVDEFAFCFDAFSKEEIRDNFQNVVNGVLATCAVEGAIDRDFQFKKVGEISYLVETDTGKPVYSSTMRGFAVGIAVSKLLQEETSEFIKNHSPTFCADEHLERTVNLLIQSLELTTDEFRSFIAAWTALEMFVKTQFEKKYKAVWLEKLADGMPVPSYEYFEKLENVNPNEYRLRQQFQVIALMLNHDNAEKDATDFWKLNEIRNELFHDGTTALLPVEETQRFLRKYLRLHLEYTS